MLKILENGEVVVSKPIKLTPRQQFRYLGSIAGYAVPSSYLREEFRSLKSHNPDLLKQKPRALIAAMYNELLKKDCPHIPHNNRQWIGVEIECLIPAKDGEPERSARDRLSHFLTANKIVRCTVKTDGSISGGLDDSEDNREQSGTMIGVEVTLTFNYTRGYSQLIKLCEALQAFGAQVNKSCGLHVHFDARHLDAGEAMVLGKRIGATLPVIRWMMPESRQNNSYCKMGVSSIHGDRYHAVNMTAYEKYRTIEVRLHSSTTNWAKICNWIELLKVIMAADISSRTKIITVEDLCDKLRLSDQMIEYVERRIEKHWGKNKDVMNLLYPEKPATQAAI
jgi:hypothetical protein